MSARRLAVLGPIGILVGTVLAGCSATVSVPPAPNANDPLCAEVSVRLPAAVDGQERRWTDAQATGAWGAPTAVILSCGVDVPGPTTLPCQDFDGVDWIIDDEGENRYRLTTFGRTPAVQVYLDNALVASGPVMGDLSKAVSVLPVDGECTPRPGDEE